MKKLAYIVLSFGLLGSLLSPVSVNAASAYQIKRSQTIMKKLGIPAGPVDGLWGSQTAQGLCTFRAISGSTPSRGTLDATTYRKLGQYNSKYSSLSKISASSLSGERTYLKVYQKCQTMVYVENGKYRKVIPVSTGKSGHSTPRGTYRLGYTQKGWNCSNLYPESCKRQYSGKFRNISNYGNMYNMRHVTGAIFVHGSTSVPTYPASHGCIRVSTGNSDWMYDNVGNGKKPLIQIIGTY